MPQHDTLTQALQQIADWNSHTTEFAVDYGSNGVRDFYRNIARLALSATQPAQAAQPVSRDVIRDVFLRNGFTIKDGCSDLKPYVYAAANALLEVAAAQPAQVAQPLPVGYAGYTSVQGFTAAFFPAEEIPEGTPLYLAPQPAAGADVLDAERYRWLRAQDNEDFAFAVVKNPHFDVYESPEELDAVIDAAIAASGRQE